MITKFPLDDVFSFSDSIGFEPVSTRDLCCHVCFKPVFDDPENIPVLRILGNWYFMTNEASSDYYIVPVDHEWCRSIFALNPQI